MTIKEKREYVEGILEEPHSLDPRTVEVLEDYMSLLSDTTAEAEPVRHGRWIATAYTTTSHRGRIISNVKYTCSECDRGNGRKRSDYCAVCGARMDLGGADNG